MRQLRSVLGKRKRKVGMFKPYTRVTRRKGNGYIKKGRSYGGSVAYSSRTPATSVVDENKQVAVVYGGKPKGRMSLRAKNIRKKKARFTKKVTKALVKLGPVNSYKEWGDNAFTLDKWSVTTDWSTKMEQTFTFSNRWFVGATSQNELCGFWYGGTNHSGNFRTQDMGFILNNMNNKLFMNQTSSGFNGYNNTLSNLGTANVNCVSAGADGLKFWVKSVKMTIGITNNITTKGICVDVYDLVCQKNLPNTSPYRTAKLAYEKCVADNNFTNSAAGTAKITLDDPQCVPSDIPGFFDYWKPKSGTRVYLQPGETKLLTFYGEKGWYDGRKHLALSTIAGKTTEFLFIVGGGQCKGVTNTDTFPSIHMVKQIHYRHQQGFQDPKNLAITNQTSGGI